MDKGHEKPPWKKIIMFNGETPPKPFHFNLKSLQDFPNTDQTLLEDLRNRISEYETPPLFPNDNWEYYKKIVNPYELVYTQNKYNNFPQSVCILKPLSRSYFKMIELLEVFKFFDDISDFRRGIRSAHACEGPGGFIEALLDVAEKNRIQVTEATAITLRPNMPNIPGWKRATSFLARNKNVKIVYGEDKTGNILTLENQNSFIKSVCEESSSGVHIYTADGGLDFSDDYLHQETKIFPIILASAKLGLGVLRKGGMMILKFFDVQNRRTNELIYFIQQFFRQWTLYKPAISRPCNPEQYFIGKGFKGITPEAISKLDEWQIQLSTKSEVCDAPFKSDSPMDSNYLNNMNILQMSIIEHQRHYLEQIFNIIKKIRWEFLETGKIDGTLKEINFIVQENIKRSVEWCRTFRMPTRQGV